MTFAKYRVDILTNNHGTPKVSYEGQHSHSRAAVLAALRSRPQATDITSIEVSIWMLYTAAWVPLNQL